MPHTFLSDDWFKAVEGLRDEAPEVPDPLRDVGVNLLVTGGPDGDREMHFAAGQFRRGLADGLSTKVTIPFDVAKDVFINANQQAAMTAFMSGQIKIDGDMSRLMSMQSQASSLMSPSAEQLAFYAKVRDLTA